VVNSQAIRAWSAASAVLDPEVPAVTVADLGILRSVEMDEYGRAVILVVLRSWLLNWRLKPRSGMLALIQLLSAHSLRRGLQIGLRIWDVRNLELMVLHHRLLVLLQSVRCLETFRFLVRVARPKIRQSYLSLVLRPVRRIIGAIHALNRLIISSVFRRAPWLNLNFMI